MPAVKVLQHDNDSQEAVVEIVFSLQETIQSSQVSLKAYCHSPALPVNSSKISLLGFLVSNIVSEDVLQVPQKTSCGYFSYRLFAKVSDVQNRCVQLGDIDIVLDCPIPKDIPEDSYISFDVMRLDLRC